MTEQSIQTWNADLYDNQLGFVAEYGKDVVGLLNPKPGERILDLGCGTGDLTKELADLGADPFGIDLSYAMIEKAKEKYPELAFSVENAETFRTAEPFDAVFSNAALHWMKHPDLAAETIRLALRPGGRFAAEFGGKGNVETIIHGMQTVLARYGIDAAERNPWYFPSIGEYSSLLERHGFRVQFALHFHRPTPLRDGERGLSHWLTSFGDDFFPGLSAGEKEEAFSRIEDELRPLLFRDGVWVADYWRIRVLAVKA
ncbi:class I SAM-dependent methyltransferase [Brevibacillus sp. B_LB10_24]|uniref:class I SAM-dependent methyltransferase n=1 Tax=Brevibacillus sp. B_LB10_24 TaxID=3380645 RepID=UPI0038B79AA0